MTAPITPAQVEGFRPDRLWSLWAIMRNLDLQNLLSLTGAAATSGAGDSARPISKTTRESIQKRNEFHRAELIEIGFTASYASLGKLADKVGDPKSTHADIKALSSELYGRLRDEAKVRTFFALSLREADWFTNPVRGWELCLTRFPKTRDDIEEASKCFALSRYPAAVFHSVQIVEHALIELGKFLQVTDPHSGWTAVSGALQKVVDKKHQDRSPFERKNFAFLEQMQGLVQGLKNAWRNKISHSQGRLVLMSKEFSSDVAEEILLASRAFTRRLAEDLPPPKKLKGRASKRPPA